MLFPEKARSDRVDFPSSRPLRAAFCSRLSAGAPASSQHANTNRTIENISYTAGGNHGDESHSD